MSEKSHANAQYFIKNETQVHLGFLPTEQSNPLTKNLDKDFASGVENGIKSLQKVDQNVLEMAKRILNSAGFTKLEAAISTAVKAKRKVVFSGCGATGRLSILLECMWRDAARRGEIPAEYSDTVFSIMTGGDYALIRSVEFFEDYAGFGARQVADLGMKSGDVLVAITEGGETSSVLGTVQEALTRGCEVFLLFNNPAELLAQHIERSAKAINNPQVCVLDLSCGPMALAGSTRMQATTSEQLIAGAALESAACGLTGRKVPNYAADFATLLEDLAGTKAVEAMADYIRFEADVYRKKGKITYFADRFLLDIFTDTTERSPTFMLPPFRRCDDTQSPAPWAFVKNPLLSTEDVWKNGMLRPLRCLDWNSVDLTCMGAPETVASRPPRISKDDMLKIQVGKENIAERCGGNADAAVLVTVNDRPAELMDAFADCSAKFSARRELALRDWSISCLGTATPLEVMRHMAIKLALNTISTGTMVVIGRVTGNWMSWVDCTNKKLLDRGTRLVAEISGLNYEESCERLFAALEILENIPQGTEKVSAVQYVLRELHLDK